MQAHPVIVAIEIGDFERKMVGSVPGAPGTPALPAALPVVTYDRPVTIHLNGEDVQLIPFARLIRMATPWSVSLQTIF